MKVGKLATDHVLAAGKGERERESARDREKTMFNAEKLQALRY